MTEKTTAYSDKKKANALAKALERLPDEWVACRDVRHSWERHVDFHVSRGPQNQDVIHREMICTRCLTVRKETYHHTRMGLDKVRQSYAYPDEYQLSGMPRGVKPSSIIHQEQFRRSMERVAAEARGQSKLRGKSA